MSGLDLYQSQRVLAMMLVYAALAGFCLGGFYDALGLLRAFFNPTVATANREGSSSFWMRLLLFAQDLLFTLTVALTLILLCYYTNDGQLRAPAVLGLAGGFFVQRQTLGRLMRRFNPILARGFQRLLGWVIRLILWPLRLLGTLLGAIWRATAGKILLRRRQKATRHRVAALTDFARSGFGLAEPEEPKETPPPL